MSQLAEVNGPAVATRRPYSDAEIERALSVLAAVDGKCRRAARELADEGLPVSRRTLARWKSQKADLYTRVRLELVPHLRAARKQRYRAIARRMAGTTLNTGEQP